MNKQCPKCKNKNTQIASKIGYYASSWFCLDCAIYFNITKKEYELKKKQEVKI